MILPTATKTNCRVKFKFRPRVKHGTSSCPINTAHQACGNYFQLRNESSTEVEHETLGKAKTTTNARDGNLASESADGCLLGVVAGNRLPRLGKSQEQRAGLPVRHVRQEPLVLGLHVMYTNARTHAGKGSTHFRSRPVHSRVETPQQGEKAVPLKGNPKLSNTTVTHAERAARSCPSQQTHRRKRSSQAASHSEAQQWAHHN